MPQKRKAQRAASKREDAKRAVQYNAALMSQVFEGIPEAQNSPPESMDIESPAIEQDGQLQEPDLSVQYPVVESDVDSDVDYDYDDNISECISSPSTSCEELESEIGFGDLSFSAAHWAINEFFVQEDIAECDDVRDDIFNSTELTSFEIIPYRWPESTPQKTVHEEAPIMDLTHIPLLAAASSFPLINSIDHTNAGPSSSSGCCLLDVGPSESFKPLHGADINAIDPHSENTATYSLPAELYFSEEHMSFPAESNHDSKFVDDEGKRTRTTKSSAVDTDNFANNHVEGWNDIEGRRIVDLNYLCKCLIQAQAHHSASCRGMLCILQEDYRSMISTLWLKCNTCDAIFKLASEKPAPKPVLRRALVWGTLCSGGTYNYTKELLAFCDIPFIAFKTFMADELDMDIILEAAKDNSLSKAVEEEKEACLTELRSKGLSIDENAPVKTGVALDGSWAARSYGCRYTSASGCAVIVAEKTKKIIFMACRNKRCSICSRQLPGVESVQKDHKCYKNYSGASGGMEPDIIIEGFQKLQEQNLWLTTITTDGDSTTVAKVKNAIKYGPSIEHQLCCNHVTKNCGKKLREIKCPKEVADLVAKNIQRITLGIRSAIKHCAEETDGADVEGLYRDIRNSPYHVFGQHDNCRTYFCKKRDSGEECYVDRLKMCGVWSKLQSIVDAVAAKADSLKHNKTSNLAENVFTRLCKYNVGKRLNLMGRGSYQRRVSITALQHNEGYRWHDAGMQEFAGCKPGHVLKQFVAERDRLKIATAKSKLRPNYCRKPDKNKVEERDYGENAVSLSERPIDFDKELPAKVQSYTLTDESKEKIKQALTTAEMEEFAKGRILPKFAADIVGSTLKTLEHKCKNILLTTTTWNHIKQNKSIIGTLLSNVNDQYGYDLRPTKIFIDDCHSYLCCIPDETNGRKSASDAKQMDKKDANVKDDPGGGGLPPAMEKSNSCSESKTTSLSQFNSTNSTAENSSQQHHHHHQHHQQQHRHPPASHQQQPTATSSVPSSAAAASTNSSDLKYLHKKFKRIASATLGNDDGGSESKKSVTSEANNTTAASAIGGAGAVVVVAATACLPNLTSPAVVNSVEPSVQQQQACANNNNNYSNNQKKESDSVVNSYESSAVRFRPEHSRTVIDGEHYVDSRLQLTFSSGSERLPLQQQQLQQQQQQQHSNGASFTSANHISGSSSFIISNNRIPVRKEESEDSKPYYPSVNSNSALSNSIYFNENIQCPSTGDGELSPESLVALQAEFENLSRGKVTVVGQLNFVEGSGRTVPSPYDPSSSNNNNNSTSVLSPHTPTVVSSSSSSSNSAVAAIAASVSSSSTVPGRYVCPYCQLNCNKPSVLEKHIRRHTNERPFRCDPCGIAFKTKSNLYKHCRSRAHASKSQGDDIGPTLDEDGSLGSDIEDKELSNSGSDIINRGSPMDDRVHSPQLLVEKPYKPKFHNAALYTKFDAKLASGRYASTTIANNSLYLSHHPQQHHIGSGSATMTMVSQSAPATSHYLNGQNVESLEQHISKLISDNEAIVEVVELPLQKKYHKITGITRGISVNSTAPTSSQDSSASSKLANALLQKRNSEELQQQQLLMLQQQQQQQQQQMQHQPYPSSEPTKPKAMVAQIPYVQNHHPVAVPMQQPQQQQPLQPQMIVRPISANEQQQQEQLQQPVLQQVQYSLPLNLSKPVPSEPAAASEVASESPRKRPPSEAPPFSREQSPSSSSTSSVQQPAPATPYPQQQSGPPSQPPTPSQQSSVTVTDHPQNPERSIIKDLLLNSRGFGVVQNPENENIENLFTCKSCNTSFRDAEILKYHTICYCRGNGDSDSAPLSPVGSPSSHFMRSRSASDRFNPTSLKNLARGLLNPPSRNPSTLSKLAKSQLKLPRSRPENIALPSSKESASSGSPSSSSTATSSTAEVPVTPIVAKIVDVVQNPLPSPGPLLGNTRLVDFQTSKSDSYGGKAASESNVVVSHVPNEETSLRRRPMDSHPAAEQRRLQQHPNFQMYGGEMEVLERHTQMAPHRYTSGGTVTRYSPDVDIEMHDSGMVANRTSMHSGGTILQLPKANQSTSPIPMNPDTPKLVVTITPTLTPALTTPNFFHNHQRQTMPSSEGNAISSSSSSASNAAQPISHFHFPPINPITAYNPLTLPQISLGNVQASPGQASQIMHGGKLIPFVQGIPGPNSMMTPNEAQPRGRPRMAPSPISIKTPQPSPQYHVLYKPPMSSFDPDDVIRHKKPVLAVPPVKNGMFKEIWSPAKQEYNPVPKKSFNFTRIADNISPRKKDTADPAKKEEIRYFNFENLISKTEILIKSNTPVESVKPESIETKPLEVQAPPPVAQRPKFLRPNSLPLKPGTWTPKRHHGITPTQNTMPLISPETPRPSKSCRELYFNGHAYTNIGLKSSTKPFYCTVNKTQPFYVQTQKQLSMYSNWQVHPENDPHPLGFKPIQVMALYDSSQQRDHRYSIATKPLALTVSSSSSSNQSIVSAVEVKTNFPAYPITQLSSPAPKPGAFYVYHPEKCAASNDSMPPRSESSERTLSGGFESNEDYTYVRGRGRGKYVCKECGIRCKKPSMLKKHIRTHTDVRPYSCQHCSFHFKTKGNLTKHMKSKSHFKKCTELGLNPIPTSVDDDGADIDIENDQQSISSERTSTIPGDSDSGSESDGEESDDSDESKSRLPEHEAAHCLLSLSMTPPTGSQAPKSYPSPVPFSSGHHLERTGRLPYGPTISPGLLIPSPQAPSQLPLPPQQPPQLTQKQLLLQTAPVDTTSQTPRRVITFGNTPKVEFNLLKHEQYYSDPNISRKKREYNPSYDDDDGVMPIDLTKKAREPPPPDASFYRMYPQQFAGQQSPSGVPIQPQSEYHPPPNRSQVIVRVSDVVTPITGAANLLTTLVSNTDKIPLTNAMISNGGKELSDDNVFFQEYIKQRALRDSKMKLSQMKSINNNQYEAEEPRPPPPAVEVMPSSNKPLDPMPPKPLPPKVNDKPYRIFNGKNELLPKAIVGEPINRIEILPIVTVSEPPLQLDPVGPKEPLVAEPSPVPVVAVPAIVEPPNTSRMETLADVAAGSLKLDAATAAGTSAQDPVRSRSNSLKLADPVASVKQSTTPTASTALASSKESAKSVASEYLKLTKSVTMRKREDSESGTASDQEMLVENNKLIPTPIVAPIVPPVVVVPPTANPATGELGGIKARTVVVGEDGFKTNPSSEFSSLSPFQEDGGRPVCEVCHKKFHKISQLKIHMNIHYMERKFRCEPCGTSFRSQGLFQKHERSATHRNKVSMTTTFGIATDSNPRPFYCKDCDVGFRIHGHLAKHLRSKMHVLKLECLGKLPFGTYTEIERSGTNLTEIDTTDCANSLSSLKRLAVRLNVKDPANVLPGGGVGSDAPPSGNETDSCDDNAYENDNESNGEGDSPGSNGGPNHRRAGTEEEDDDDGEDGEISGGDQAPQGNNNNLKRKPDDSGTTMTNCDEIKRPRFHGPPPMVVELGGLQAIQQQQQQQHQPGSAVATSGSATGET